MIPVEDPRALTAGEQDHSDPWRFAGEVADPPEDCGRPAGDEEPTEVGLAEFEAAGAWRNCQASLTLVAEINARWPGRDRRSDGTIGDAAHASRDSDHNPWIVVAGMGVVRARDIDVDGIDAGGLFEQLRQRAAAGDSRLTGGGYLIINRRITSPDFHTWRVYNGSNPHTSHGHVSFSRSTAGFDSPGPWGLAHHQEDDMTPEQDRMLREVHKQLFGPWETRRYGVEKQEQLTLVDLARGVDRELNSRLSLEDRPGPDQDSMLGQVLSERAEVRELHPRE